MAAHNAPVNAQQGAQSAQQSEAPSFITPLSRVTRPYDPASPPTQTSPPPIDCRWKRGRPVTFSSRAFSTKPARLSAQASAFASTPATSGAAVQAHEHEDVETARQQYEQSGNTAAADQQYALAEGSPRIVQRNDVFAQTERVVDGSSSLEEAFAVDATMSSPVNILNRGTKDCDCTASTPAHDIRPLLAEDGMMENASDTDYVPSSSDESATRLEEDGSEAEEADEDLGETHTPLEFQIPEDVLRAAMTAPENTKASFWSSNLYRGPDDTQILVHYCKTKEVAERVAKHFVNEKVVGFDIEWKPYTHPESIKKNVSLIQLACEDRIALFHVALFQGSTAAQLMPPTLKTILESADVYKVGVAVKGDFSRVIKFLHVEPQGVFELSRLHNLVQHFATDPSKVSNKLVSLASQVQQHLQLPLYKGGQLVDDPEDLSNVRSSDWSLPLNLQQIHYAAADAYAGFRLFDVLEEKRKQLKPTPSRPLVCDYDSKPKPRSSDNKPRKKRTPVVKTEETAEDVAEEPLASTERTEEPGEATEEQPQQSQDTEGYETAQEDFLDSHQLEGDERGSSEGSFESTDKSDGVSTDSEPSMTKEEVAAATDTSQKRRGRINLSRLRGLDPSYPTLPKLRGGADFDSTSDEDLINLSDRQKEEEEPDLNDKAAGLPEENEETDEFDDPDLEEALLDLNLTTDNPAPDKQEQSLDPPNESEVVEPLHPPTQTPSPPEPTLEQAQSAHSHSSEYTLATNWARTYLVTSIPSPTSLTPSHIRATVPHLRAYHMWHYQQLSLDSIAQQLRDPPLSESTVGSYVLQAITLEKMKYDEGAVRGVLMMMPEALRKGKWRGLAEKVGAK